MGFAQYNGKIREIGRKILLPVDKIKNIVRSEIPFERIDQCVDFGAGTMFWSKWLAEICKKVFAVDIIYDEKNESVFDNIVCVKNISGVNDSLGIEMFWCCDVIHHLDMRFAYQLLDAACNSFEYIVIKDIDCNKRFGNMMNRLHDRFINGEIINDVDPALISNYLLNHGYETKYFYIPKLWYPHFLLIAKKKNMII